jgi:hypothetical protein
MVTTENQKGILALKEEYEQLIRNYSKSISQLEVGAEGGEQWLGSVFAYRKVVKDLEELLK